MLVVLACICVFTAGCMNQQQVENNYPPTRQVEQKGTKDLTEQATPDSLQENGPMEEDASPVAQEEKVVSYQFKKSIYQNGHLTIYYPQLIEMEDGNKEQQINELLKKEVIKYVTQFEDDDATLNMDYQVIMNSQYTISILYTGDYSVSGGMYPTHLLFTTNVNIKDGEKIRLSDVVSINEMFIDTFKQSPYIDWEHPSSPNEEKTDCCARILEQYQSTGAN